MLSRARRLWLLVGLAVGYGGLLRFLPTVTGNALVDGAVAVVLGLYICAHPAANAIDLFFSERLGLGELLAGWDGLSWLLLNLLVVVVGWFLIASGMVRLVG